MCVNYLSPEPQRMRANFKVELRFDASYKPEIWQHYEAPIIVADAGQRIALLGEYGLVPRDKMPPGVRLTTMNARAETIGSLRSYKRPWAKSQLCLVPMDAFFEPNYESGKALRWQIGLASGEPFAVAGMWEQWDAEGDNPRHTFTQITVNADDHPFMRRFHKPGDEKRSLVIVKPEDYDEWLSCRNPEIARAFLQPPPADLLVGLAKAIPPRKPATP